MYINSLVVDLKTTFACFYHPPYIPDPFDDDDLSFCDDDSDLLCKYYYQNLYHSSFYDEDGHSGGDRDDVADAATAPNFGDEVCLENS